MTVAPLKEEGANAPDLDPSLPASPLAQDDGLRRADFAARSEIKRTHEI